MLYENFSPQNSKPSLVPQKLKTKKHMKVYLIALMLLIGFVLTLHLAMNAQVGAW